MLCPTKSRSLQSLMLVAALLLVSTSVAGACTYAITKPLIAEGETHYIFRGPCGLYEVGYRLEGTTLHFPRGGEHTITNLTDEEAQQILRDTYGLVGSDNDALIRTEGLAN